MYIINMNNQLKIQCPLCTEIKEYSLGTIGIHLSSKHKGITLKEFYLKYIDPNHNGMCKFCGVNEARFLGLTKGFRNNCASQECYNKSVNPSSKEYKMKVDGMSEFEFGVWKSQLSEKLRIQTTEGFARARQEDPDFDKKNSKYCKEFWMKKGHSEETATQMAYDETQKNRNKLKDIKKDDPDYQKGKSWNSYKYWMKKGMDKQQAIEHVSKLQATFTLEKCIEKYGEEEGRKKWQERQDKWMKTLDSKSDEEKLEILKKKIFLNNVHSKVSQDLFDKITSLEPLYFQTARYATRTDGEIQLELANGVFLKPDFAYENKIIEFYGDYWHCSPKIFPSTQIVRRGSKKYRAASIWKMDAWREKILREAGYEVKVVWEHEYKEDPEKIIIECYNYLKDVNS
jgi:hypothetical protein